MLLGAERRCLDDLQQIGIPGPVKYQLNKVPPFDGPHSSHNIPNLPSTAFENRIEDGDSSHIPAPADPLPWDTVDVPGSPRLTRLLAALNLHYPTIEPLSLSQPRYDPVDTLEVISPSSLHRPSPPKIYAVVPDNWTETFTRRLAITEQSGRKSGHRDMKYKMFDVFFPTGDWITPDPYHELYPFPSSVNVKRQVVVPSPVTNFSMELLSSRANSLNAYLASIEGTFSPYHTLIITTLEELANTYCEMGDHDEASKLWSLVARRKATYKGSMAEVTFRSWFMLLRNLFMLGERKAKDAKILCDQLESLLEKNFAPDHPLAISFSWIKADTLASRGLYAESERLFRTNLQLRLTTWGPRNIRTLICMAGLGKVMALKYNASTRPAFDETQRSSHNPKEESSEAKRSEFLVQAAMSLLPETEDPFDVNSNLDLTHISTLIDLGRCKEALPFVKIGAERARRDLGDSHPTTLHYLDQLGLIHLNQGRFQESARIFQTILRLQKLDDTSSEATERVFGLGKAFRGLKNYQEAKVYLERAFRNSLAIFGALSNRTPETCWYLGDTYTQLEEYLKASEIYHLYIHEIQVAADIDHPFVTEVQGWLDQVNQYLVVDDTG